jgi:multidrug efflux pump
VFAGMLGVTLFGIFLTPVFYFVIRWIGERWRPGAPRPPVEAPRHANSHFREA